MEHTSEGLCARSRLGTPDCSGSQRRKWASGEAAAAAQWPTYLSDEVCSHTHTHTHTHTLTNPCTKVNHFIDQSQSSNFLVWKTN